MTDISIKNQNTPLSNPLRVKYCDSFLSRMLGLMFSTDIDNQRGILLVQARDSRVDSAIHMFFVFTDLAVFWINSGLLVVDRVLARSWRPVYLPRDPARFILEIHPDRMQEFQIGDHVEFVHE